jgi:hypothetical protein
MFRSLFEGPATLSAGRGQVNPGNVIDANLVNGRAARLR